MNDNKVIWGIIISTALLLIGSVILASKVGVAAKVASNADAKAEAKETFYDWGQIGINNGVVSKEFEVKNIGTGVLKLYNTQTSCSCTTAQLLSNKSNSPLFKMHSKSAYVMDVEPGDSARVKVVFDPAFHGPNAVGPIERTITVTTNDPTNPQLTFNLKALVTK